MSTETKMIQSNSGTTDLWHYGVRKEVKRRKSGKVVSVYYVTLCSGQQLGGSWGQTVTKRGDLNKHAQICTRCSKRAHHAWADHYAKQQEEIAKKTIRSYRATDLPRIMLAKYLVDSTFARVVHTSYSHSDGYTVYFVGDHDEHNCKAYDGAFTAIAAQGVIAGSCMK
jgi:hypothetical protein